MMYLKNTGNPGSNRMTVILLNQYGVGRVNLSFMCKAQELQENGLAFPTNALNISYAEKNTSVAPLFLLPFNFLSVKHPHFAKIQKCTEFS